MHSPWDWKHKLDNRHTSTRLQILSRWYFGSLAFMLERLLSHAPTTTAPLLLHTACVAYSISMTITHCYWCVISNESKEIESFQQQRRITSGIPIAKLLLTYDDWTRSKYRKTQKQIHIKIKAKIVYLLSMPKRRENICIEESTIQQQQLNEEVEKMEKKWIRKSNELCRVVFWSRQSKSKINSNTLRTHYLLFVLARFIAADRFRRPTKRPIRTWKVRVFSKRNMWWRSNK